jgi:hypothetical protein
MTIPTEPIGSIPRPLKLLDAISRHGSSHPGLEPLYDEAVRDTIEQFEATGSPVVTDGEQRKYHNFATYCAEGLPNTAPDGFKLPFAAGHTRRWPRLTGGPRIRGRNRTAPGHRPGDGDDHSSNPAACRAGDSSIEQSPRTAHKRACPGACGDASDAGINDGCDRGDR